MRISILSSSLASYSVAFFRALSHREACTLQLVHKPASASAPYGTFDLSFCKQVIERGSRDPATISNEVRDFAPDCILMTSWNFPDYMRIARREKRDGAYVVSMMDNQWNGTAKQVVGIIAAPLFLRPAISTFLVAGDRQAQFARRLGYDNVMYGLYSADTELFIGGGPVSSRAREFLFVGRLSDEKGIRPLLEAYQKYRGSSERPWGLTIAGVGSLASAAERISGVTCCGFVPPNDLPSLMHRTRCLILPSRWEPWGVVIHEAVSAGLPVIATAVCGATTAFVRDGVNGSIVGQGSAALAKAMIALSTRSQMELDSMSEYSRLLGRLWSPKMLAHYLVDQLIQRTGVSFTKERSESPQRNQ